MGMEYILVLCVGYIFHQSLSESMTSIEGDPLRTGDFKDCWISIYHNPLRPTQLTFPFNSPLSLPPTVFQALDRVRTEMWNISSIWNSYTGIRKHLYCSAYFLIHPQDWDVHWTGAIHRGWTSRIWRRCNFWYEDWKRLVPFRDGTDFLILSLPDPERCRLVVHPWLPIANNIIFPSLQYRSSNSSSLSPMTLQVPFLLNLSCSSEMSLKECLLTTRAKHTNNGKTLIAELDVRFTISYFRIQTGFWLDLTSIQNYTRINREVVPMGPMHTQLQKYPPTVGSNNPKIHLIAADVLDLWIPTENMKVNSTFQESVNVINQQISSAIRGPTSIQDLYLGHTFNYQVAVIATGSTGMVFTTKHGVYRRITFGMYFTPYDRFSWIGILTFTLLIPLFFYRTARFLRIPQTRIVFEDVLILNVAALLHGSPNVSTLVFSPKFRRIFYCTVGVWLMMLVVIVEAYCGVIVGDLVVPPPWQRSWAEWQDLQGFLIFGSDAFKLVQTRKQQDSDRNGKIEYKKVGDFRYCQCKEAGLIDHCKNNSHFDDYCHVLYRNYSHYGLSERSFPPATNRTCWTYNDTTVTIGVEAWEYTCNPYDFVLMLTVNSKNDPTQEGKPPLNAVFIEGRYSKLEPESRDYYAQVYHSIRASEQIMYMDNPDRVAAFEAFANSMEEKLGSEKQFMTGSSVSFLDNYMGFCTSFRDGFGLKLEHKKHIVKRMQNLVENGVAQLWEKWDRILFPKRSDQIIKEFTINPFEPKPLTFKSNMFTIFIVSTSFVGLCTLVFIMEKFSSAQFRRNVVNYVHMLRNMPKDIWNSRRLQFIQCLYRRQQCKLHLFKQGRL